MCLVRGISTVLGAIQLRAPRLTSGPCTAAVPTLVWLTNRGAPIILRKGRDGQEVSRTHPCLVALSGYSVADCLSTHIQCAGVLNAILSAARCEFKRESLALPPRRTARFGLCRGLTSSLSRARSPLLISPQRTGPSPHHITSPSTRAPFLRPPGIPPRRLTSTH